MLMACAGYETLRDISVIEKKWSERRDSNPRPPSPQLDTLPDCATLRHAPFIADTALSVQAQDRKKDVGEDKRQPGAC